jgi:hypothetical protein
MSLSQSIILAATVVPPVCLLVAWLAYLCFCVWLVHRDEETERLCAIADLVAAFRRSDSTAIHRLHHDPQSRNESEPRPSRPAP